MNTCTVSLSSSLILSQRSINRLVTWLSDTFGPAFGPACFLTMRKTPCFIDSNGGAQKPLYIEATSEQGTSRVAQEVARMQLSQVVALLIDRWEELDSHSREEILRKLE